MRLDPLFPCALRAGLVLALLAGLGCDRVAPSAAVRASSASATPTPPAPNPCLRAAGAERQHLSDAWFPKRLGEYCVDPHADARAYGKNRPAPLRAACDLLGGDCEHYGVFGLDEVLSVAFVNAEGGRARLGLTVLAFGGPEAAYGYFTERVHGVPAPGAEGWRSIEAGTAGALSGATALVMQAERVAELVYTNELAASAQSSDRAASVLPRLARELGVALPKGELPRSAALLPSENRGPLAVRYEHRDLFGVSGLGPGALGEYSEAGRTYYVAVLARGDEDSAKDVERVLSRLPSSRPLKGAPIRARRLSLRHAETGGLTDWLFSRKRDVVLGVGTPRESRRGASEAEARLSAIARLKRLSSAL